MVRVNKLEDQEDSHWMCLRARVRYAYRTVVSNPMVATQMRRERVI